MGQSETDDTPVERRPDGRVAHGWITLDSQTQQGLRSVGRRAIAQDVKTDAA